MCNEFLEYLNCLKSVGFFSVEEFHLKSITIYLVFRTSYSGFEALFSKKRVNEETEILKIVIVVLCSQASSFY